MTEPKVTFKGNPLTLSGNVPDVGEAAPDFTANKSLMEQVSLSSLKGKRVLLTAAPSVDTGICAMQLRKFNQEVTALGDDVAVVYITLDLPFALGRFCAAEGIKSVTTLSDYKLHEFGAKYGLVMNELGLLARSVFVIDRDGKITYREVVPEMASEPNYDAALGAVKALG